MDAKHLFLLAAVGRSSGGLYACDQVLSQTATTLGLLHASCQHWTTAVLPPIKSPPSCKTKVSRCLIQKKAACHKPDFCLFLSFSFLFFLSFFLSVCLSVFLYFLSFFLSYFLSFCSFFVTAGLYTGYLTVFFSPLFSLFVCKFGRYFT